MNTPFARTLAVAVLLAMIVGGPAVAGGPPARQAPPFTLELFNGQSLKLADLTNKVVVLLFWAEW